MTQQPVTERERIVAWLRERIAGRSADLEAATDPDNLLDQLVSIGLANKWDEAKDILAAIERGDHLKDQPS